MRYFWYLLQKRRSGGGAQAWIAFRIHEGTGAKGSAVGWSDCGHWRHHGEVEVLSGNQKEMEDSWSWRNFAAYISDEELVMFPIKNYTGQLNKSQTP
jgi:hypothetical protein